MARQWTEERLRLALRTTYTVCRAEKEPYIGIDISNVVEEKLRQRPQFAGFHFFGPMIRSRIMNGKTVYNGVKELERLCDYDRKRGTSVSESAFEAACEKAGLDKKHLVKVTRKGLDPYWLHIWHDMDRFYKLQNRLYKALDEDKSLTDAANTEESSSESGADTPVRRLTRTSNQSTPVKAVIEAVPRNGPRPPPRLTSKSKSAPNPVAKQDAKSQVKPSVKRTLKPDPDARSDLRERTRERKRAKVVLSATPSPPNGQRPISKVQPNVGALEQFGYIMAQMQMHPQIKSYLSNGKFEELYSIALRRSDLAKAIVPLVDIKDPGRLLLCLQAIERMATLDAFDSRARSSLHAPIDVNDALTGISYERSPMPI
ncbi:uncharacterized protein L969DRAFT_278877 [Mixia osmundae IAM 14324]|uniref:Uncharacterized protein n=1 Tax=Mixia osmundae (strain CBS 9802 / IAM 14324 / JCM 22182 / KY 12970) TaxID=764103 RepID=G7E4G3_MIXOS|nr:uncharacterized protein L969DRAFT_278877 [Mixia osmundae IAM 14324]KEI36260.1 hypothetical protein L969DRAFT_278877 [Mixia osmundae IAM 14324]GAA97723.1 hypothetical protein E5Q_04402 [Mixia osmundae IAM 14324]